MTLLRNWSQAKLFHTPYSQHSRARRRKKRKNSPWFFEKASCSGPFYWLISLVETLPEAFCLLSFSKFQHGLNIFHYKRLGKFKLIICSSGSWGWEPQILSLLFQFCFYFALQNPPMAFVHGGEIDKYVLHTVGSILSLPFHLLFMNLFRFFFVVVGVVVNWDTVMFCLFLTCSWSRVSIFLLILLQWAMVRPALVSPCHLLLLSVWGAEECSAEACFSVVSRNKLLCVLVSV